MRVIFPEGCTTPASRLEFCYKAQENTRLLHNFFGEWYDPDKPDIPYDRWFGNAPYPGIPPEIQAKYPYIAKIDKATWDKFLTEDFEPMSFAISIALGEAKADAAASTFWNPDFSNLGE